MIAVRPPEYYPRLEYAALMTAAERFVLADTFQYSRQSFQNRTRVRNPQGWQWVSVPLKGGQHGQPICQARIRHVEGWRRKHWRAFYYNYRAAPFFAFYEPELAALLERTWTHLADLTCATVELVHRLLALPAVLVRASDLPGRPADLPGVLAALEDGPLLAPEDAAPHDAPAAPGLRVFHYDHPRYRQTFAGFEPGMTALDLLFNYGPEARSILRQGIRVEA